MNTAMKKVKAKGPRNDRIIKRWSVFTGMGFDGKFSKYLPA
jgi:hypothetical protein